MINFACLAKNPELTQISTDEFGNELKPLFNQKFYYLRETFCEVYKARNSATPLTTYTLNQWIDAGLFK